MKICLSMIVSLILSMPARAEPVQLEVDFAKPDGRWDLPRYALGQGGLQSDPMLAPHVKELRQLVPAPSGSFSASSTASIRRKGITTLPGWIANFAPFAPSVHGPR